MKIIDSSKEIQRISLSLRGEGKSIGFVPTMGALHNGHISLLRRSRKDNDISLASIFVNPLQFLKGEDYDKYPRQVQLDKKICDSEGVDILFMPQVGEMYPKGFDTYIDQTHYTKFLCGIARPGHFKGVMTIVAKLFNIVNPSRSYFGHKDYQQYLIVKRMAEDLDFPTSVILMPTVREEDGLAISSRNAFLGPKQRRQAPLLYQSLLLADKFIKAGTTNVKKIKGEMTKLLKKTQGLRIEYIEFSNANSLEPLNEVKDPTLIAAAIRLGNVRLIDSIIFTRK